MLWFFSVKRYTMQRTLPAPVRKGSLKNQLKYVLASASAGCYLPWHKQPGLSSEQNVSLHGMAL
jgi:hypothetical protein